MQEHIALYSIIKNIRLKYVLSVNQV